jgi:hypothetical protein
VSRVVAYGEPTFSQFPAARIMTLVIEIKRRQKNSQARLFALFIPGKR